MMLLPDFGLGSDHIPAMGIVVALARSIVTNPLTRTIGGRFRDASSPRSREDFNAKKVHRHRDCFPVTLKGI